jgi:hypothetical protein
MHSVAISRHTSCCSALYPTTAWGCPLTQATPFVADRSHTTWASFPYPGYSVAFHRGRTPPYSMGLSPIIADRLHTAWASFPYPVCSVVIHRGRPPPNSMGLSPVMANRRHTAWASLPFPGYREDPVTFIVADRRGAAIQRWPLSNTRATT